MGTCGSKSRRSVKDAEAHLSTPRGSATISISHIKQEPVFYDESNATLSSGPRVQIPSPLALMSDTKLVSTKSARSSLDMVTIPDLVEPVPGSIPGYYHGISLNEALRSARVAFYSGLNFRLLPNRQLPGKYDVFITFGDNNPPERIMLRSYSAGYHHAESVIDGQRKLETKPKNFYRTTSELNTPTTPSKNRSASLPPAEFAEKHQPKRRFSLFRQLTFRMKRNNNNKKPIISPESSSSSTTIEDSLPSIQVHEEIPSASNIAEIIRDHMDKIFYEDEDSPSEHGTTCSDPDDIQKEIAKICQQIDNLPAQNSDAPLIYNGQVVKDEPVDAFNGLTW